MANTPMTGRAWGALSLSRLEPGMFLILAPAAVALGFASAALPPQVVIVAAAAAALMIAVGLHPPLGAYVVIALTPLIAGIDRGRLLPVLRPSEALALLVAVALVVRRTLSPASDKPEHRRNGRLHATIVVLAAAGSILPLGWMLVRGIEIEQDDVLYALQLWKLYAIFLIVRLSVRTERQVGISLGLSLMAGGAVALLAIMQALEFSTVDQLLSQYYGPIDSADAPSNGRATSTLGFAPAVADLLIFNLAIAMAWLLRRGTWRPPLLSLAAVFVLGILAAGQFAGFIGLLVGGAALGFIARRLGRVGLVVVPAAVGGIVALWPVINRRLSGFDTTAGVPPTWIDRLENLQTYFWPELFRGFNWVLGVRPAARLPASEPGVEWVFIESGHTWLLWTGGVPLLAAFLYFLWTAGRTVARIARERADAIGVAAVASFTALVVLAVLMTFDPHLTHRASADLSFALLALATTAGHRSSRQERYQGGSSG